MLQAIATTLTPTGSASRVTAPVKDAQPATPPWVRRPASATASMPQGTELARTLERLEQQRIRREEAGRHDERHHDARNPNAKVAICVRKQLPPGNDGMPRRATAKPVYELCKVEPEPVRWCTQIWARLSSINAPQIFNPSPHRGPCQRRPAGQ
jgi:hypothetical protein